MSHRRHAHWSALWAFLGLVAGSLPNAGGWSTWIATFAVAAAMFQAGRWWSERPRHAAEASPVVRAQPGTPGALRTMDVRAYVSAEEAQTHGWEFSEPLASYAGSTVFRWAQLRAQRYEYEGLVQNQFLGAVPADKRVFGKLCYHLESALEPDSEAGVALG